MNLERIAQKSMAAKIQILNILAEGSLSILSLGSRWRVNAYKDGTLLGEDPYYGKTLNEALDKVLEIKNDKNSL